MASNQIKKNSVEQALTKSNNDYSNLQQYFKKETNSFLNFDPLNSPPAINTNKQLTVTVVIPCWNAGETILSCLSSIEQSSFNIKYQNRLQVVVVDDGSTDDLWNLLKKIKFYLNFTVVQQKHSGVAHARNTGISVAGGEIIVICDPDMILHYQTIEHFVCRHQILPNVLLAGFRADVPKNDKQVISSNIKKNGAPLGTCFMNDIRIRFPEPGWPNNMCLTSNHYKNLGFSRGLWMPFGNKNDPWLLQDLVFGALFSLPVKTYNDVGGFDEHFKGWSNEDGHLAAKALASGCYIIPVYSASGFHISHPFRTGDQQVEYSRNRKLHYQLLRTTQNNRYFNWIKKAKKRILNSFSYNRTISLKPKKKWRNSSIKVIENYIALGEFVKANKIFLRLDIDDQKKLQWLKGEILFGLGKYLEAIDVFKKVSSPDKKSKKNSLLKIMLSQSSLGRFKMANKTLKTYIDGFSNIRDVKYWINYPVEDIIFMGRKYYDQRFFKTSLRCFENALILDCRNKMSLNFREKILKKMR